MKGGYYDNMAYEMYPDNCCRCSGTSGGVRGNENRVNGRILCDYCSVDIDRGGDVNISCNDCSRPLYAHRLMDGATIEACWAEGIVLTICGNGTDWEVPEGLSLVAVDHEAPTDPCDEDFMKEISS